MTISTNNYLPPGRTPLHYAANWYGSSGRTYQTLLACAAGLAAGSSSAGATGGGTRDGCVSADARPLAGCVHSLRPGLSSFSGDVDSLRHAALASARAKACGLDAPAASASSVP